MATNVSDFKFTDVSERELIRQEATGSSANGLTESMGALLGWALAVVIAIGSVFVIVLGDL